MVKVLEFEEELLRTSNWKDGYPVVESKYLEIAARSSSFAPWISPLDYTIIWVHCDLGKRIMASLVNFAASRASNTFLLKR